MTTDAGMNASLGATLGALAQHFTLLSFMAIGGISTILPEMHRIAVGTYRWMTDQQFNDLYAIARAAPGPNFVLVTALGWEAAGLPGAFVATTAVCAPAAILAYIVTRTMSRIGDMPAVMILKESLIPLTVGLVGASSTIVTRGAVHNLTGIALALAVAFASLKSRVSPVWLLAAGAVLGLSGIV